MERIRRPLTATFFVLLALSITTAAFAAVRDKPATWYRADLHGANESPAVDSDASGEAVVNVDDPGQSFEYRIKVRRLDEVVGAHIHAGAPGENGPVVAVLATPLSGSAGPPQVAAAGVVGAADLVGPYAGDWDGFMAALDAGMLYVNVHTSDHPGGEIRGQLVPSGPVSPPASGPASPPVSPPMAGGGR